MKQKRIFRLFNILISFFLIFAACAPPNQPIQGKPPFPQPRQNPILLEAPTQLEIYSKFVDTLDFKIQEFREQPNILNTAAGLLTNDRFWNFSGFIPTGKSTIYTISVTGTVSCQSTFLPVTTTYTTDPDPNSEYTNLSFGAGPGTSSKDGIYDLTIKDDAGSIFQYKVQIENGIPAVCSTPSPSPSSPGGGTGGGDPSPSPSASPSSPGGGGDPTPEPSASDKPCHGKKCGGDPSPTPTPTPEPTTTPSPVPTTPPGGGNGGGNAPPLFDFKAVVKPIPKGKKSKKTCEIPGFFTSNDLSYSRLIRVHDFHREKKGVSTHDVTLVLQFKGLVNLVDENQFNATINVRVKRKLLANGLSFPVLDKGNLIVFKSGRDVFNNQGKLIREDELTDVYHGEVSSKVGNKVIKQFQFKKAKSIDVLKDAFKDIGTEKYEQVAILSINLRRLGNQIKAKESAVVEVSYTIGSENKIVVFVIKKASDKSEKNWSEWSC